MPAEQRVGLALRAIGLGGEGIHPGNSIVGLAYRREERFGERPEVRLHLA